MQKHTSVLEQEKDDYSVAGDLGADLTTITKGIGEGLWWSQRER